jgi:C1A family cysteine protease
MHNNKLLNIKHRKLGHIMSPIESNDYHVRYKLGAALMPMSIDLTQYCSPVKDQGNFNSCSAFATLSTMELLENKSNINNPINLSEYFTYYITRVLVDGENVPPPDDGATFSSVIKSLVDYGTCTENLCKYNRKKINVPPSAQAYLGASSNQIITYARFNDIFSVDKSKLSMTIDDIKINLASGYPLISGFNCYSNIIDEMNGVIPLQNDEMIGSHGVSIVGYDDTKKLFKFKNSWGTGWGDKGYGYLPYEYYLNGDMYDIWSIYQEEIDNVNTNISTDIPIITSLEHKILQNEINDIFDYLTIYYNNLLNSSNSDDLFLHLTTKYKDNIKLVAFINSLKVSFNGLLLS